MAIHKIGVDEEWFTFIKTGVKNIEGRLDRGKFEKLKIGDIIMWRNNNNNDDTALTQIYRITKYDSFDSYLANEGLRKTLPSKTAGRVTTPPSAAYFH